MSLYGVLLEFEGPERLIQAATLARRSGLKEIDAFTPFPVEGLSEALGLRKDRVAFVTLLGGLIGCVGGFFMQWYANVEDYPLDIGGKPLNSWPAYIPVTFELTVLGAALAAAIGMLVLNRLPELWHPCFQHPDFHRASLDRFFLCILASDPNFDTARIQALFGTLQPIRMEEISDEQ